MAEIIDDRTTNRDYPKPAAPNWLADDVGRLRAALDAVDDDVASILASLATKSAVGHGHAIGEVTGLQSALDGKAVAGHTHAFDDLSDVSVAGAANGQVVKRVGGAWLPATLQLSDVFKLESELHIRARLNGLSVRIPSGSTAERPLELDGPLFRYNTTLGAFETWDGSSWGVISGQGDLYLKDEVDIGGGTIDATPIGAETPATGAFTTLSASAHSNLVTASFSNWITVRDLLELRGLDSDFRLFRVTNEVGVRRWEIGTDNSQNFFLSRFDASGDFLSRVFRANYLTGVFEVGALGTEIGQAHVVIGDGVLDARWIVKTGGYSLTFAKNNGTDFVDAFRMGSDGELYQGAGVHKYFHEGNAPLRHAPYESPEQAITPGGPFTLAHGLGVKPTIVSAELVCKTAEHGFLVGETIPAQWIDGTGGNGVQLAWTATDVVGRYSYAYGPTVFKAGHKDTGIHVNLTDASWRLVVRAFA